MNANVPELSVSKQFKSLCPSPFNSSSALAPTPSEKRRWAPNVARCVDLRTPRGSSLTWEWSPGVTIEMQVVKTGAQNSQTHSARRLCDTRSQFPNWKPPSIKDMRHTLFRIALGLRSILRDSNRNTFIWTVSKSNPTATMYKLQMPFLIGIGPSSDWDPVADRYQMNYSIKLSFKKAISIKCFFVSYIQILFLANHFLKANIQ